MHVSNGDITLSSYSLIGFKEKRPKIFKEGMEKDQKASTIGRNLKHMGQMRRETLL